MRRRLLLRISAAFTLALLASLSAGVLAADATTTPTATAKYDYDHLATFAQGSDRSPPRSLASSASVTAGTESVLVHVSFVTRVGVAAKGGTGALERLPEYAGGKTSGILDTGSREIDLVSGYKGPSAELGRGTPGMNGNIKSHVEAHAAAVMRQQGLDDATLYINRVPCSGARGCDAMLPRMLPPGARLHVYGPNGFRKTYTGLPDG